MFVAERVAVEDGQKKLVLLAQTVIELSTKKSPFEPLSMELLGYGVPL
jgi:hypothetical protein